MRHARQGRKPVFKGENDEVLKTINGIFEATGGKGIVVYDRGGDRPAFYGDFIEKGRDFIVRAKSRSVLSWNGLHEISFVETTKDIGVDFALAARFT